MTNYKKQLVEKFARQRRDVKMNATTQSTSTKKSARKAAFDAERMSQFHSTAVCDPEVLRGILNRKEMKFGNK